MPAQEYTLLVGLYAGPADAVADLRTVTAPGHRDGAVGGAAILHRGVNHSVLQQGGGGTMAYSIGTGMAAGVVAGVVLAIPLVGAAAGAAIGAVVGRRLSRREVDESVAVLADAIPVGATALVAVVDEAQRAAITRELDLALRVTARTLDGGPLTGLARSLVRGNPTITEALSAPEE